MTRQVVTAVMTLLLLSPTSPASGQPGPFDSQAASIQALTVVGTNGLYAGSFGALSTFVKELAKKS